MAYGGDFLQQLMANRRQGSTGMQDTISESLGRRKKRREERTQRMQGFQGLRGFQPTPASMTDYRESSGIGSMVSENAQQGQPSQAPNFAGDMNEQMNNGGQDLPPQDGNMYSPTAGQGFNLNNMLRRKRNEY